MGATRRCPVGRNTHPSPEPYAPVVIWQHSARVHGDAETATRHGARPGVTVSLIGAEYRSLVWPDYDDSPGPPSAGDVPRQSNPSRESNAPTIRGDVKHGAIPGASAGNLGV